MRAAIRRLGNSSGVIIPKSLLDEAGVTVGDAVEISLSEGRIVLTPVHREVRTGWDQASRGIAEAADDMLEWPEFGNAGDETLTW